MDNNSIKLFCGVTNEKNLYLENKTLLSLYSAFALFFAVVTSLLDYYKTHNLILLLIPGLFFILIIIFSVWLLKIKDKTSYNDYFAFQGIVTMAISFVWLYLCFSNIKTRQLGFSYIYLLGFSLGVAFGLTFLVLRLVKWKNYQSGKIKVYNKSYNVKIVIIAIILLAALGRLLKNINSVILYRLLSAGLLILFFIFLSISLNMFVNHHIIKKYL